MENMYFRGGRGAGGKDLKVGHNVFIVSGKKSILWVFINASNSLNSDIIFQTL